MLSLDLLSAFLAQAQAAPPRPGFLALLVQMIPMLFMIFFVFWVMVIRPEQRKIKSQEGMLNDLKKGDQVLTTGGIIAKVAAIENDHILLEISQNVKVKFQKRNVVRKIEKPAQAQQAA